MAAAGARGLKVHPNQQAFDVGDAELRDLVRQAAEVGLPLLPELSALISIFAASPFTDQITWICRQHGLDRVLWGSDYPFFDPTESLSALDTFGFTEPERDQITSTTAARLYRLD